MHELGGWGGTWLGAVFCGRYFREEQFQVMSRSRVKLWEWEAGREYGWSLEDETVKELNGKWRDGPHPRRKTM